MSLTFVIQEIILHFGMQISHCQKSRTAMYAIATVNVATAIKKRGICFPFKKVMLPSGSHTIVVVLLGYFKVVNDTADSIVRKSLALLSQINVARVATGLHSPSSLESFCEH